MTKRPAAAGALLFSLACLALALLTSKITVYCDDYFYGLFFRRGWSGFWELTVWHYLNFNGRAFVHLMAELALVFDTKLLILLNPLMLAGAFALGCRAQSKETPWGALLAACAAGMMGVMALPAEFLSTSLLWLSASFNYLFPVFFLLAALRLYMRGLEKGRLHPLTALAIFLAGATTEQSGLAAIVCIGGWGVLAWLRRETGPARGLAPLLLSGAGYASVIFAPGTWVRVGNEQNGGFASFLFNGPELVSRFRLCMSCLTGERGLPALFVLLCLLLALHALVTRRSPKALLASPTVAALYLLLRQGEHYFLSDALAAGSIILVSLVYLLRRESAMRGLLLLGALATQLVMMLNTSTAPRTAVPAILLLLIVCASLAAECLEKLPEWSVPLLAAAAMLALLPPWLTLYRGYSANAQLIRANELALRRSDGETIVLDIGLDDRYRYRMYHDSMAYLDNALEYYGAADGKISYTSDTRRVSGIYNGRRSGIPACEEDGTLYLPIQNTAVLLGGDGDWDFAAGGQVCRLDGRGYLFRTNGEVLAWDTELERPGETLGHADVTAPWYTFYAPAELLQELFGFTLEYNGEENIYYIYREELAQ